MNRVDFLIVGGSAAGTTAAEVIRGLKPEASISIITDENHEQYSRVLIPHYIRGKVGREQVFLKKPEWYIDQKINLLRQKKVKTFECKNKIVTLEDGEQIQYGKLLISIGGYVIKLPVPGAEVQNIYYMRTIENADEIIKAAKASKKGLIVGGGFIGLEFCSCFRVNGVEEVIVLVREPYYWQGKLDEASSKVLVGVLERNGVKVLTEEEVDHFERDTERGQTSFQSVGSVVTKSGKRFDVDVVGVGIGIKSDLSWLDGSGININKAIVTNEYLETSLPDVYAAGDCAEFKDVIFERQHIVGNWSNATSQGAAVGKTMAGVKTVFETASSYTINFFDGSCSFIGVTDADFADEVISRGSVENGKMTRIFVKSIAGVMRLVGATVINDPAEVAPLSSAVRNKTDISSFKDKFSDVNFDLKEIIP